MARKPVWLVTDHLTVMPYEIITYIMVEGDSLCLRLSFITFFFNMYIRRNEVGVCMSLCVCHLCLALLHNIFSRLPTLIMTILTQTLEMSLGTLNQHARFCC